MSDLSPLLFQRFFDADGAPLAGGKIWSYQAGTTTALETFTDDSGDTPCTNPIILDANGEASFYIGDTAYKFVLMDEDDVVQRTIDNVLSLRAQIAAAVNTAGALAIVNNLSEVASKAKALSNLEFSILHPITASQGATTLTGETFDGATYRKVKIFYDIIQGVDPSEIAAAGELSLQFKNGTWALYYGSEEGDAHGLAFTISQTGTVATLKAAESLGEDGSVVIKKHYSFAA